MIYFSVNVSQSTLAKLVYKLAMPAGSCIAWNMASNLMAKCPLTRLLEVETIVSTPSSVRLVLANMYPELSSSIWSLL